MRRERWGIIGMGTIGRLFHQILDARELSDELAVTAVADTTESRVRGLGAEVTAYTDYRELLRAPVDVVVVATPPSSHHRIALDALEARKGVLVEKPPAPTVDQCNELIAAGARSGAVLFFAFHSRYNLAVEHARDILRTREVESVRVTYQEHALSFHQGDSWVHAEGALRDSGINAISVLTHVLPQGAQLEARSAVLSDLDGRGGERRATLTLRLPTGAEGVVDIDWRHEGPEKRHITLVAGGDEFTIDISHDRLYRNGELISSAPHTSDPLRQEYGRLVDHFRQCLRSRTSSCSCAEVAVIERAHRIARRT